MAVVEGVEEGATAEAGRLSPGTSPCRVEVLGEEVEMLGEEEEVVFLSAADAVIVADDGVVAFAGTAPRGPAMPAGGTGGVVAVPALAAGAPVAGAAGVVVPGLTPGFPAAALAEEEGAAVAATAPRGGAG